MKKTISINLNETIFQIEEDAYSRLEKYLNSIKNYYKPNEADEIVFDIEASISEKLNQKVSKEKNTINLKDVEEIIGEMGSVNDFEEDVEKRDINDNANKNENDNNENGAKRFYRNPDDVILGGVCSGIAAYFDTDPLFVRIFFIVLTLFWGSGVIVYLILWIIIPEAKNSTQKLEMKGKPINLEEIQELVREKSKNIKEGGKNIIENIKSKKGGIYKISDTFVKIIGKILSIFKKILFGFFPVLAVLIGISLLVGFLAAILAITVSFGLLLFNINSPYIVSDLPLIELSSSVYYYTGLVSLYFTALIPLIFLSLSAISLIKRKKSFGLTASMTLIIIWILAVTGVAISTANLGPKVNSYIIKTDQEEMISTNYDFVDFTKLNISGYSLDAKIVQGDQFNIQARTAKNDLNSLLIHSNNNELVIRKKELEEDGKLCLFCREKRAEIIVTMPYLESLTGSKYTNIEIDGFADSANVNLDDYSDLKWNMAATSTLYNLDINLSRYSEAQISDIDAEKINIQQSSYSDLRLSGKTNNLEAELSNYSELNGFDLVSQKALINTTNYSKVTTNVLEEINATAKNYSKIIYSGQPNVVNVNESNYSSILNKDL